MRNVHCRIWDMARKLTKEEHMTHTLQELEYGKKTIIRGILVTHIVRPEKWRETLKIVKNEKYALQYLAYGEKPDNHRK